MRVVPLLAAGALVLAACGSSATDDAADSEPGSAEATPDSASPATSEETTGATTAATAATAAPTTASTDGEADDPASDVQAALAPDPSELDPGTAVVVVDGRELRFARSDSIFDVCDLAPDFDLGQVEMELVEGPDEGGPHFNLRYDTDAQTLVVAFLPDTGFVAGAGEETDPYVENFGIVPPVMDPIEVGDGVAAGTIAMVDVFAGDEVEASLAVRCA
jgi:hypothetical protein